MKRTAGNLENNTIFQRDLPSAYFLQFVAGTFNYT